MFCIQASIPSAPIAAIERLTARRLISGLREKVATISEIAPAAGSTISR